MFRHRLTHRLRVMTVAAAAGILGACATPQSSKSDADLLQLEGWLPGHYDNRAQVATDHKHGGLIHPAVSAVIVRVDSLTVGKDVYYMEESDTDNLRQITAQHILSFEVVKDRIVEAVWTLAEPARWHNGAEMPELFSALQPPDLKLLTGCSLEWKRTPEGFTASNDQKLCHSVPPSVAAAVNAHWRMELSADQLGVSEQAYDSDGDLVYGTAEDSYIRLRKRSNSKL
ncbi:MAG: CpcT/CpeT family chromophore lyase [Steroidobacteraceae bacterium]